MKVAVFSTRRYDEALLNQANGHFHHELTYLAEPLGPRTVASARGYPVVCVFVNDVVDQPVLEQLAAGGTRLVAIRATGFNNVDVRAASQLGIDVVRVVNYSPDSVAEFAVGLLLALDRKIVRASRRTREGNFDLDGLMGFDLVGKTVGVIGVGKIGRIFARILHGFGSHVLGHDICHNDEFVQQGGRYVPLDELLESSDVISLHCPLTPENRHIVNRDSLARIKHGCILVNTSRGGLVDTEAAIEALKNRQLGGLAIDVYEREAALFFQDLSSTVITDDVIQRLVSFPNVIVTGHQGFFTREAIGTIMETTLASVTAFERGAALVNRIAVPA